MDNIDNTATVLNVAHDIILLRNEDVFYMNINFVQ